MNADFIKVKPENFNFSSFSLIGQDWLQITAADNDKVNTMTASWGGLGVMFNRKAAFVFIRPQRFTKTIVDAQPNLTLQVLPESDRELSSYFGRVSGANEDKIAKSGVKVLREQDHVYFENSEVVLLCKKLYAQAMTKENFAQTDIVDTWYQNGDFHTFYILEIEALYVKKRSKYIDYIAG